MNLNLGCGEVIMPGYIGIDKIKTKATDIVHDLNVFPYPLADNSAKNIIIDNVLEHLDDTIAVMEEVYRIAEGGASITIKVPYFKSNSAFTDPTHKQFFSEKSFMYFEEGHPLHFYTKANFRVISANLISLSEPRDTKHFLRNLLPFKRVLNYFLFNIYDEIHFELEAVK